MSHRGLTLCLLPKAAEDAGQPTATLRVGQPLSGQCPDLNSSGVCPVQALNARMKLFSF